MKIYHYRPETGEFVRVGAADASPLEENVWLIPAYAAVAAPPEPGAREVARYLDADGHVPARHEAGAWHVAPDWRGVPLWDTASGTPAAIERPGITPSEIGATDIERTDLATVWSGSSWVTDAALANQRLTDLRTRQLSTLNAHTAALLATLSANYPDGEVASWAQQTREADALAANPTAAAPLLTAIATARGVPLGVLAERVRAKVQAYAVASGQIIGQRQGLEDALNAVELSAPDAATRLEAIAWPAA